MHKSLVIAVRDLIRGEVVLIAHAINEAQFVRDTLPVVVRDMHIPIKDVQFVQIGEITLETGELSPVSHRVIPNDVYKWNTEPAASPVPETEKQSIKEVM